MEKRKHIVVIAAGTTNNFFGIEGLRDRVFTLKSTAEAIRCRNEILLNLEIASVETDPTKPPHSNTVTKARWRQSDATVRLST